MSEKLKCVVCGSARAELVRVSVESYQRQPLVIEQSLCAIDRKELIDRIYAALGRQANGGVA